MDFKMTPFSLDGTCMFGSLQRLLVTPFSKTVTAFLVMTTFVPIIKGT